VEWLQQAVCWEVTLFLAALIGVVAFQLMTGRINTRKLLSAKTGNARGGISPERVQLLISTLAAAAYYVMQVSGSARSGQLPDIPATWPAAIGGSNLIYLAGKAYGSLIFRSNTK